MQRSSFALTQEQTPGRARWVASTSGPIFDTSSFSHVRLTVTDIERSRAFYDAVFGFPVAFEMPADADVETREQP